MIVGAACHPGWHTGTMAKTDKIDTPFADIAARLHAAQAALGLSQKEFAERAGISEQQMSNYKSGVYRISLDSAIKLRETWGLSMDFIYFGILDALPHRIAKELTSSPDVMRSQ